MTISTPCYPLPPPQFLLTPPPMIISTPCYPLSIPKSLSAPPYPNLVFFFEQSDTIIYLSSSFFSQVTFVVCFEFLIRVVPCRLELISLVDFCCGGGGGRYSSVVIASVALLQDQSSILSIHVVGSQLPLILVSLILFWTLWPPVCACTHIHTQT